MPSLVVRCLLFLSSYFPLALIFFLLFVEQQPLWSSVILAIALFGLIVMILFFLVFAPRLGAFQEKVTGLERRDGDVMSYIASYLLPFVAIPFSGWQQGAALLVFILVLGIVYVNSNMIHVNPMLNLMGYHLYSVTVEKSQVPHALITQRRVALGETLHVIDIGDGIFLEKRVRT
ncbi:MAG TPA: hypothetical protein VFA41_19035 [Ktedonobacteraceae bacterium]|jgi:hypothetical protein|nr:hypothetical protein [Ktedonobacteraceae bacterium]